MSSHCTENSASFDSCCNENNDTEKGLLTEASDSKKCCTSKAGTCCSDFPSFCTNADVTENKANSDHCCRRINASQCFTEKSYLVPSKCCTSKVTACCSNYGSNAFSNVMENKVNSGSCCNGSKPSYIPKNNQSVVPDSKKYCTCEAALWSSNVSLTCCDSSTSAEMKKNKNATRSCCSTQTPNQLTSFSSSDPADDNNSATLNSNSRKGHINNISVSNRTDILQPLDGSMVNPEHPCDCGKPGSTKPNCNKSKKTTEKQGETSSCCRSRDASFRCEPKRGCCVKSTNSCCFREETEKSGTGQSSEENAIDHGGNSCFVNSEAVAPIKKHSSSNNSISKSQIPCCKSKCSPEDSLNISKKTCCSKVAVDTSCSAKRCSVSKGPPNREEMKATLSSCSDSKTCNGSFFPDSFTKLCCSDDPCKDNANVDCQTETSKKMPEDFFSKETQVSSCYDRKGVGLKKFSSCCSNKTKELKAKYEPCFETVEESDNMVCSCCEKDKININPKKIVPYFYESCCELVIQADDSDSDSCTPLCDDINGHHSTCINVHKSTFTISTSTMPLNIPNEPDEEDSSHEDKALLPQKCTTKLRVQNICCVMEANLVRECLEPMQSVFSVTVNVIGRVAHVQHNPQITSPTDLVNCLNKIHLGASIMETGSRHDSDKGKRITSSLKLYFLYLLIQTVLFTTAVVGFAIKEDWYQWVAVAEIVFGILPVIKKAFISLKKCTMDISILMLIAVIGTIPLKEWIEGAAVVFVFAVAEVIQDLCMYKVQQTISSLMLKAPQVAVIAKSGECVPVEDVTIGTVIAVRPGELVALDGVVVSGRAAVDESSISGEAVPVEKSVDSVVYSGTVNQNGYIEVRTTSDFSSSTVSKVSQMVQEAQASSATTEILINRFAKFYTPVVIAVSALIVIFPAILGASGVGTYLKDISEWGRRALVMLVIACPCALVMSTPIAIVCGITAAARKGALIKGGVFMETLARLETLAFDKTGTLTEGKFQVINIECDFGLNERETLRLAAALESKSIHPLAAAIVNEFSGCVAEMDKSQVTDLLPEVANFKLHEGRGVSGVVEGQVVEIGNFEFVISNGGVLNEHMKEKYHQWSEDSKTVVFVCIGSKLAMMIALADSIRPNTTLALDWLKHLGVRTSMITGDNSRTAAAVRNKLGLDQCASEMKPKDKLLWIQNRQQQNLEITGEMRYNASDLEGGCLKRRKHAPPSVVGMVGDGINDGPALAAANVGIAMGAGGTALAVEAADVALMSNNLAKIPELVSLGRFCRRVVIQNICFSVLLKLAVVIAAILGEAALWMAVCADVLGLLFVILNGLRPLWWSSSWLKNKEDVDVELAFAKAERVYYTYETCV